MALVDVTPTILQAAHLPVPAAMQGQSLWSFLKSDHASAADAANNSDLHPPVYSESDYGRRSFGWSFAQAWRSESTCTSKLRSVNCTTYLLIRWRHIIWLRVPRPSCKLRQSRLSPSTAAQEQVPIRELKLNLEQTENLHALGYLGTDSRISDDADNSRGADPKKIAIANLLYGALVKMEREQYQEAVPILEQVLKEEPSTPIALLHLGRAYISLKEYQKAVPPLRNLVAIEPEDVFARYEFGCALVKTGNWTEATPHFEAAVSQVPSVAMMHFYLAFVYQRTSRPDDAKKEFQEALRLDPNNFPANLLLGRLLIGQQRAVEAVPYLRKAAKLHPDSIDAHGLLSDALRGLGQEANARRELSEAERIRSKGGSRLGTPTADPGRDAQRP